MLKLLVYAAAVLPMAAQVPSDVPAQYQAIYTNMTAQISAFQTSVNQGWNKAPYAVNWSPHLTTAESSQYLQLLAANYYNDTVLTQLQELQATGAKSVTVHIDFPVLYQPFYAYESAPSNYEQFVAFYQQLVSDVHARGMKLIVEAVVAGALDGTDGADFAAYYKTLDWNEYMAARAQNALNVARLIKPDYLSLICEPDSEATSASQPTEDSPAGALQLLQTILTTFQEAGETGVNLGAGAGSWIADFTTYLQEFSTTSVNYIDIHVYPVNESFLMNVLTGMTIINRSGKAIGVSEAWPNKIANDEIGILSRSTTDARDVFSFWAPVDIAFLQALVDCSQYQKVAFFSPSYPTYFASYLNYNLVGSETPAQLLPAEFTTSSAANGTGTFTSTGAAFSQMIVGVDKTPPVAPAAPTSTSVSSTSDTITWTPTTDNIGVAGYNIYRDGVVVARLDAPPFHDTGLTSGTTYSYKLSAFDAQGNVSGESPTLNITTIDLSPPSVPTSLKITSDSENSVSLSWSASTGGGGVGGYRVLKGTSPSSLSMIDGYVRGTSYTDPYTQPSTTYYYSVESYNVLGISSAPCTPIRVTTN